MSYVERLSLQNHIKIMTQINLATSCFYKALFHSCDRIEIMLLTVLVLVIFAPPWCQNMSPSQRLFCNKEENVWLISSSMSTMSTMYIYYYNSYHL